MEYTFSVSNILNELDENTKKIVDDLASSGMSYDIIGDEISKMPSFGLSVKGGGSWDQNLFRKILNEVAIIICRENSGNEKLHEKISSQTTITEGVFIVLISDYLGEKFGMAGSLLSPMIVLALAVIFKATKQTFCKAFIGE